MKKILLIDDEFTEDYCMTELLNNIARDRNIIIDFITDCQSGIDQLRQNPDKYHLILLDGNFKKQTIQGLEAATIIRTFCPQPIIMISNDPRINKKALGLANDCFEKLEMIQFLMMGHEKIFKYL